MAGIEKTKEILGFMKILFGLILATIAAIIGWVAQNYSQADIKLIIISIIALFILVIFFLILLKKITIELNKLGE